MIRNLSGNNRMLTAGWLIVMVVTAAVFASGLFLPRDAGAETRTGKAKVTQKTFASPDSAVTALVDALKANDRKGLLAIFGPGSGQILFSGDRVADRTDRANFVKAYAQKHRLDRTPDTATLVVGATECPFPIPIVMKDGRWVYDTKAGREEVLNRRIGGNEISAIKFLMAYVTAQREYASKDRDKDGKLQFADRLESTPGKHDGLYWDASEGEELSPLGPLAAAAASEGYGKRSSAKIPEPYHGYYYKILTAQGPHAPGGAYSYIAADGMLLGFAAVAYPARYGSSGIMTFIVNQQGIVFQKDLGPQTDSVAAAMEAYDPDPTWKEVQKKFME